MRRVDIRTNETTQQRQRELTALLDRAARAYEQENRELISNFEYDKLYDELKKLEEQSGIVLADSPTLRPGYEVLSDLPKFQHESPMLSLDKTKDREALISWLGVSEGMLSWKMDGLTVVLTYRDGVLFRAVTRGNGEIGEVITNNARVFRNLPKKIPFRGELVLRGEAFIRYSDFERINEQIEEIAAKYKNPRNLCSGAVRQLNNKITEERCVNCYIFTMIGMRESGNDESTLQDGFTTRIEQMEYLKSLGFETVDYRMVTADTILDTVSMFASVITENDFPSDGLVLSLNNIAYGKSLGRTSKFPRDSIAFKWADEVSETKLLYVEWSASRTGLINPVAVFEPVELEGTTVSRASIHNVSITESLALGIGDTLQVYKANMIIPQIAENLTRSGTLTIPQQCPVCKGRTEIRAENDVKVLICTNPDCQAKKIKAFAHFVSRDAMNIEGLSEASVEKLIDHGCIHEFSDLFRLEEHRAVIEEMEGFGKLSCDNLVNAAKKAAHTTLPRIIYSLGIAGVGLANAKLICRFFGNELDRMRQTDVDELTQIEGIGEVIAEEWVHYFNEERNNEQLNRLLLLLNIEAEQAVSGDLQGKIFVVTGSIEKFANRNELKAYIEQRGGRVTGSVSAKTDYLINNDAFSNSSKNKTAKELGVAILTEEEFLQLCEQK